MSIVVRDVASMIKASARSREPEARRGVDGGASSDHPDAPRTQQRTTPTFGRGRRTPSCVRYEGRSSQHAGACYRPAVEARRDACTNMHCGSVVITVQNITPIVAESHRSLLTRGQWHIGMVDVL